VSREEIGEEHDFVHQRFVGTKCAQSAKVVGIHGNDAVEGFEVFGLHGARTVGESIAVGFGVPPHAHIGEFALVVVDHAGGVNARKFGRAAGTLDVLTKNLLGNGRTTDVAETNKEDIHEQMGWLRSAKIEISVRTRARYDYFTVPFDCFAAGHKKTPPPGGGGFSYCLSKKMGADQCVLF